MTRRRHSFAFVLACLAGLWGCSSADETSGDTQAGDLEVRHGHLFFEDCIDLGPVGSAIPPERLQAAGLFDTSSGFQGAGTSNFGPGYPWPGGVVYFRLATAAEQTTNVAAARVLGIDFSIAQFRENTSLRLVEVDPSYGGDQVVVRDDAPDLCSSALGRKGGIQYLNVGGCSTSSKVLHEFGHAIGLLHEHQRSDRDQYVTVLSGALINQPDQYGIVGDDNVRRLTDFDVDSIMLYNQWQSVSLKSGATNQVKSYFSAKDVIGIQAMYGSEFEPPVAVVSPNPGQADALVRGGDGGVFQQVNASYWVGHGGVIVGSAEGVSWGPNRLDVFVRGTDLGMWHCWSNGTQACAGWENLGGAGNFRGHLSAVSTGSDRLDVFGKKGSGVARKSWNGSNWEPSEWGTFEDLGLPGGIGALGPVKAVAQGSIIRLFALDFDRGLQYKAWTGSAWVPSQTGWWSLGGLILGSIAAAASTSGRFDIVVKGGDDRFWLKGWDGAAWIPSQTGWIPLGTRTFVGNPTVGYLYTGSNVPRVCGQESSTRQLYCTSFYGSGDVSWDSAGGALVGSPALVSPQSGRLDVFWRGDGDGLYRKYLSPTGWWPSQTGYQALGGVMTW